MSAGERSSQHGLGHGDAAPYWDTHHTASPPAARQRNRLTRGGDYPHIRSTNGPEPVFLSNPLSFEDFFHVPGRRDSIWSDVSVMPVVDGVGLDKLTEIGAPDLPYVTGPAYMPSEASSVAGLSTISRTSSIQSTCSRIQTDSTYDCHHAAHTPRGPSPLRSSTTASPTMTNQLQQQVSASDEGQVAGGFIAQDTSKDLNVCLWGNGSVCKSRGFATREQLNRHVKLEHLLECPVQGCTEVAFESREVLTCHMQWDHGNGGIPNTTDCRSANLLDNSSNPSNDIPHDASSKGKAVARQVETTEDRVLKMEMSIGIHKKRCRDQLRTVLEKRSRRANGMPLRIRPLSVANTFIGTPRSADSPGMRGSRTPKPLDNASFPIIWEHGVLPFLIEFMPKWVGPGHVISVIRGKKPNTRRICIMTRRTLTKARRIVIVGHIRDLLPESLRNTVSFLFSTGKVDRLVWARGFSKEMPDEVCEPRNPFAYISPCMGDSIGASLDGDEVTATLGPSVTADGGSYWLACFHPFVGANQRTSRVLIEHPSPQDRAHCLQEQHDTIDGLDHSLGRLTATSGFDLKTTRVTHDPYWEDYDKDPPLVVTDWILISQGAQQANLLRRFPSASQRRETPVVSTGSVSAGANVISTGRTSGFQRGQICEIPAYVDGSGNGTGKATREWFIEEPFPYDNENDWIKGGIGVEGDSGAAIVDSETNALVGQLWGRNQYWGPGPRLTFFTPISDIFDDIQEKCGMSTRPQLPQYREEADRWPVYPVCKQCYDLQEYLDSRRSSRESFMSMIGMHDGRGEHDNDLTSVSELATPKDQSCLVRHLSAEDVASTFGGGSVVSPAPIHAFYPPSQAPSPGPSDLRSPYPQALSEEDLYDSGCPRPSEVSYRKRSSLITTGDAGTSQQPNKRMRTSYNQST